MQNNSENNDFKSKFEILKKDINLAQNKNGGNEKLIKSLSETCNDNNKKIIELEIKLTNLENEIKTNTNEHKNKINNNSNNILNFENKLKKN